MSARARILLAPGLLVLVAVVQLVRVQLFGQSRWRGGGFGMYSEYHPRMAQIWLTEGPARPGGAPTSRALTENEGSEEVRDLSFRCRRVPTEDCLHALAAALPPGAGRTLEIWRPALDPGTGVLSRRRLARIDF